MKFELNLTAVDLEGNRTDLIASGGRLIGTDILNVLLLSEEDIARLYDNVRRAGEYHTLTVSLEQAQKLPLFAKTCRASAKIPVEVLRAHMTFDTEVDDDDDDDDLICVPKFDVDAIITYLRRVGA